jgi:hypothetical protein
MKKLADRSGLVTTQLQQEPTTRTQPTWASSHDLGEEVRPVGPAIERQSWFKYLDVARQQAKRVRRDVWHDSGQDVDAVCERAGQRIIQKALEHLDTVSSGALHSVVVEFGRNDLRGWNSRGQHGGDCACARAQIRRPSRRRKERCCSPR